MNYLFAFLFFVSSLAFAAGPRCALPNAPASFLEMVAKPRQISAKVGGPAFLKMKDPKNKGQEVPNLMSACRITPAEITGDDPFTHQPRLVKMASYAPKGTDAGGLRTVLLMPPTGGENLIDDSYAEDLCRKGFRVVIVQSWENDRDASIDLASHDRGTTRAVAAVLDVMKFIDPKTKTQVGLFGTSLGAIISSAVLGVDSRISAATLIVGGANLPDLISQSDEEGLVRLRQARFAEPSLRLKNIEDYKMALAANIKIEPLEIVKFAQKKKILTVIALKDKTVPTASQFELFRAFGSQDLVVYDSNHFRTIVHTGTKEKDRISAFFSNSLAEPTSAEVAAHASELPADGNFLCQNAKVKAVSIGLRSEAAEKMPVSAK